MTSLQVHGPFKRLGHCTFCGTGAVACYPAPRSEMERGGFDLAVCHTAETHPTACPDCCGMQEDGHEYEYERGMARYECERCGDEPPLDWSGYHD